VSDGRRRASPAPSAGGLSTPRRGGEASGPAKPRSGPRPFPCQQPERGHPTPGSAPLLSRTRRWGQPEELSSWPCGPCLSVLELGTQSTRTQLAVAWWKSRWWASAACRGGVPGALPGPWVRRGVTLRHVPCPRVPLVRHGSLLRAGLEGWQRRAGPALVPLQDTRPGPSQAGPVPLLRRHPPPRPSPARCHGVSPRPLFPPLLTPLRWFMAGRSSPAAAQLLAQTLAGLVPSPPACRAGRLRGDIQAPHAVGPPCI